MTDWKQWFEYYEAYPLGTIGVPCSPMEDLYQAFKSRLMHECSVVERMTKEEYDAWMEKMVIK